MSLVPPVTPTSTPLIPPFKHSKLEIVLFVGYPCIGKSSFYGRHFEPAGYVHVNQDTLKTRLKCIKAAEQALESGQNCVIGQLLIYI
jgi:bifunctional polynucleotide phosphatase/kinase